MAKARIVLPIEGMICASCAATVQDALGGGGEVGGRGTVGLAGKFGRAAAVRVGSMLGAMLLMADRPMGSFKRFDLLGRLLMPVALKLWALASAHVTLDLFWRKVGLAVVTLPVVVWSGQQVYRGAWSCFRHRTADM